MEQEELNQIVAENLTRYRKGANLTQLELAERLNYSDKSVSKWEQGNGMPDVYVLHRLAEMYGVSVNDFLQKHDDRKKMLPKNRQLLNRMIILSMSVGLCWLVAVIAFTFLEIFLPESGYNWHCFIYAIPVSLVVAVVLSCVWRFYILRAVTASGIIWTGLLAIYLTLTAFIPSPVFLWLFLIGAPLQVLVVQWFVFRGKGGKRKEENEKQA